MQNKPFTDNLLLRRRKELYNRQSDGIKKKLDKLSDSPVAEYQFKVIKRTRKYPEIGNIFRMETKEGIVLYGVVINNHVSNENGDNQLVVAIYKPGVEPYDSITINNSDCLLVPPFIVTKGYWTLGYFYTVNTCENLDVKLNYGFYEIAGGYFLNEYGEKLEKEPEQLGMYGMTTFSGVAHKVNQLLIINGFL